MHKSILKGASGRIRALFPSCGFDEIFWLVYIIRMENIAVNFEFGGLPTIAFLFKLSCSYEYYLLEI